LRRFYPIILAVSVVPVGIALAWTPPVSPPEWGPEPPDQELSTSSPADPDRDARLREGTPVVNQVGYFRTAGDRLVFYKADGRARFIALENLNLERISNAITDKPTQLEWNISGTITEYRGANYLLVDRAILLAGRQRESDRKSKSQAE